jgi:hypothetical protein
VRPPLAKWFRALAGSTSCRFRSLTSTDRDEPRLWPASILEGEPIRNVNAVRGMRIAAYLAGLVTVYVLFIRVTQGPGPFEQAGTSVLLVIASYWIGGLIAGFLVGIALPLARGPVGAALLGVIGGVPLMFVVGLPLTTPAEWRTFLPVMALLAGGTGGPLCAVLFWHLRHRANGSGSLGRR